ncbi:MAG: DM13 domain-containing protein [Candidatus Woesearchaeota archaeon]|nr:DM13 domain-containing protein [Candidatus Woesearchaeota archaeon]
MRWILLLVTLLLISCGGRVDTDVRTGVDSSAQQLVRDERYVPAKSAEPDVLGNEPLRQGTFKDKEHETAGLATVYKESGILHLALEDFHVDRGPDLFVYLSTDEYATNAVNLGKLRSFTGDQTYIMPSFVNIEEYKHVLIWCKEFGVLFGAAELE